MFELRILGPLELVAADGRTVETLTRQPKRLALLAYLAVSIPQLHRRDSLVALFWPELDEPHARNALSQALHVLRAALGESAILMRGDGEVGVNPDVVRCDVGAFEAALHLGPPEAAVALYRGELLDGFFVTGAPEFERWLDGARERLRRRAAEAATRAADAKAGEDHLKDAVTWARRAVQVSGHEEALVRRLIELLDRAGDRAGAIREYRDFQRRLKTDLDVEPSPETMALVAGVRSRAECVDGIPITDGTPEARTAAAGTRRVARMPAALALGVLVALAGAWIAWQRSPDHLSSLMATAQPTRIAVFPFRVQGGSEFTYLGEGVMDALSEAIDGLGDLRRVQPFALTGQLRRVNGDNVVDPEHAGRIARELGARRYVLGKVVDLGSELSISASLYELGGTEPLAQASVHGKPEQLAALVTQLTRELVTDIPLGRGARLEHVGTVGPGDFDAFKAYLQGEALLRRGWYDSAAARLRAAVEADSTFAVAWYRLGLVLGLTQSFGQEGDNYTSLARAARHGDELSRRDRQLVDAWRAHFRGQSVVAERLAREVAGSYPDDVEAWHLLGLTRMWYAWQRGRPFSEARVALERALAIDPFYPDALYHAVALAMIEARYGEADSLMRLAPTGVAVGPWALANMGLFVFALGDGRAQERFARRLDGADDQTLLSVAGVLANHSDSLTVARRLLARLAHDAERSDWGRAQGQILLAHVEAARGRWREARAQFVDGARWDPAIALSSYAWLSVMPHFERPRAELVALRDSLQRWQVPPAASDSGRRLQPQVVPDVLALPDELRPWIREYLLGLVSARLGDQASADKYAATLRQAETPRDTVGLRHDMALEIRALAALEAGRADVALRLLEKARMAVALSDQAWYPRFYTRPFGRFLRAEALRLLGRDEEALGWYATLCEKYGAEYVYRATVFLRQGEIQERRGDRRRALEYYRRFIARWRDADPEYQALVREVERRIGQLTMESSSQ